MTEAQPDTLSLGPQAAGEWTSAAAEPAAPRRLRRILSGRMVSDAVMLFDIAAVLGAGLAVYEAYLLQFMGEPSVDRGQYVLGETLAALLFVILCQYQRAYRLNRLTDLPRQLRTVARNLLLSVAVLAFACFFAKVSTSFSRGWALLWIASAAITLGLGRLAISRGVKRVIRAGYLRHRCVVIGDEPALGPLLHALREGSEEPAEVVGVFPYRCMTGPYGDAGPAPDRVADLIATLRALPLDEIIIALADNDGTGAKPLIDRLKVLPADIRLSLPSIAHHLPIRGTSMIGRLPMIDVAVGPLKHWHFLLKATFDRSAALVLLILFSPLLLAIALLIKLDSRGPVFFVQDRFGFNNNVIRVIKFRTMHVEQADPSGGVHTVRGDERITRFGRLLRAHSLDELPQLLNVLSGEMSLVGPRPHALAMKAGDRLYHEVVSDYFARHRVKPGITGWAQVNGLRGEITSLQQAQQRVEYDLHYIENWSFWLDLKILLMSAREMLGSENAV